MVPEERTANHVCQVGVLVMCLLSSLSLNYYVQALTTTKPANLIAKSVMLEVTLPVITTHRAWHVNQELSQKFPAKAPACHVL